MEEQGPLRIHDISLPVHPGMAVYPGDAEVEVDKLYSLGKGDPYNLTVIRMGAHAGTHLDAPNHFLEGGAEVDAVPLERLLGPARVIDWRGPGDIDAPGLAGLGIRPGERVLFKTANSGLYGLGGFSEEYVCLAPDGAAFLCRAGVALVGIDYLSIEGYGAARADAHLALLTEGIAVLEGLDLGRVTAGEYWLVALPLKLLGAEGAPVRAVLLEGPPGSGGEARPRRT